MTLGHGEISVPTAITAFAVPPPIRGVFIASEAAVPAHAARADDGHRFTADARDSTPRASRGATIQPSVVGLICPTLRVPWVVC